MKIVVFQGGLGNQLFQYQFLKYAERTWTGQYRWMYEGHSHNGMEIERYFDIKLPQHASPAMERIYLLNKRIFRKTGWKWWIGNDAETDRLLSHKPFLSGYWQDKRFYQDGWLAFKPLKLNKHNQELQDAIQNSCSVALHVRRGDYLLPQYAPRYAGVCTEDYYERAIETCRERLSDIRYFVFSDDVAWVRQHLPLQDATYVDWNHGDDSVFDMYLMSHAQANIIANSSFSYWAARLNRRTNLVIYPARWYNHPFCAPDIFPNNWIGL